jgi:hypothetical protein
VSGVWPTRKGFQRVLGCAWSYTLILLKEENEKLP